MAIVSKRLLEIDPNNVRALAILTFMARQRASANNDAKLAAEAAAYADRGLKAIPDPYTNNSYWENVVSQINTQLPGTVDGVHLQAYAGGAGNNPCAGWNFGAVPVCCICL